MSNISWEPWCNKGQYFCGTFDGQNHTIKNLTIIGEHEGNDGYAVGFIGRLGADGRGAKALQNVTFDNATVTGNHYVAVAVGYNEFGKVENVHVTNSNVTATHANNDQCGDKAGALIGMCAPNAGYVSVTNCSATNCVVKAARDAGQLIGMANSSVLADKITGCTATGVTVSATTGCTDDGAGKNIRNEIIGRTS